MIVACLFVLALVFFGAESQARTAREERQAGDEAMKQGNVDQALKHFETALELDPQDYMSIYNKGMALKRLLMTKKAVSAFDALVALKPEFLQGVFVRGQVRASLGKFDEALVDMARVLELKAGHQGATTLQKKLTDAKAAAAEGMRLFDAFAEAAGDQQQDPAAVAAALAAVPGGPDVLVAHLTRALDVAHQSGALRAARAQVHAARRDVTALLDDTKAMLKHHASDVTALRLRGLAFYLLGQHEAATQHYKQCNRLDPDNRACRRGFKLVRKFDKELQRLREARDRSQWAAALDAATATEQADPRNPLFRLEVSLARCQALVGLGDRADEAIEQCTRVLEAHGQSVEALIKRAEAKRQLGRYEEAIGDYNQAKQVEPQSRAVHEGLQAAQRELKISKRVDYYAVLQVERTANKRVIKKAYRAMAVKYHPDSTELTDKDEAERQFLLVGQAYEILSDEDTRRQYDQGMDLEDIQKHKQQQAAQNNPHAHQHGFPFGGGGFGGGFGGFNFRGRG